MRTAAFVLLMCVATIDAADPTTPVFWSADALRQAEARAKAAVDPNLHRGVDRLLDSATVIYRDGPSEAEAHTDRADFISVREGRGTIVVGGSIVEGRTTTPGEIRGKAIEGGQRYDIAAGDALFIPVNVAHQFFVEPGGHFVVMIVKVVPR